MTEHDWTALHDPDVAAIPAGRPPDPVPLLVPAYFDGTKMVPARELVPPSDTLGPADTAELVARALASDRGIDAADLLAMELPQRKSIVAGVIEEGTAVIASPPKVGKSCLMYQACVEVAIGGDLLGRRAIPGAVLYLALEDGMRRGQDRLRAALAGRTMPHGRLEVRWTAPPLGGGLEDELRDWLDAHPDAALVVIDTLGKVRGGGDPRRNAYAADVEDLGRLQNLFRDRGVALILVHHLKKDAGDDFLAAVSGTYGITGSVDTIIVIRRKRMEAFGTISVTGREVAEDELSVRFDGMTWTEAPKSIPAASFSRTEVYRVIEQRGPIFPKAIADELDLERTNVQHMVDGLVSSGAVARTTKGYVSAGVSLYTPTHSTHSESDGSEGGYTPLRVCPSCHRPHRVGTTCSAVSA